MYTVEFLPLALNDLKEIAKHIAETLGSPQAAIKTISEITEAIESMREFPYSAVLYTPIKPLSHEYRKLTAKGYSVFYWITDAAQTITVVRILHNRRNSVDHLSDTRKAGEYR